MKINISAVHFKADKKLEVFIQEKVEKLVSMSDKVLSTEVILKIDSKESVENKIAEIRLIIKGNDLFAKKQCKSFEEATDIAVDALKKQLTKYKEK
jgi:putative sigma-54 modulation protein